MPTVTIVGKKGSGKSYYGLTKYVLNELVYGDRCVVGTLAIKLPELSAYLADEYPHKNIDVNKRVRLLSREEGRKFWLHRGPGIDLQDIKEEEYDRGLNPDYSSIAGYGGVLYIIDECHVDFDARAWAKIGRGLTYYMSQERKLLDDQVFMTPFLSLVDKRVKDFSQEYIMCRNFAYERVMGYFSKGSFMRAKHFPSVPKSWYDPCDESKRYRVDARKAECYDTSAGVGFQGKGKPDTKGKKRRLPWQVLFLLVIPAYYIVDRGTGFGAAYLSGNTDGGKAISKAIGYEPKPGNSLVPVAASTAGAPVAAAPVVSSGTPAGSAAPGLTIGAGVRVRGYAVRGDGRANVVLSNGMTVTEEDRALTNVSRNGATVNGVKLFMIEAPPASAVAQRVQSTEAKPTGAGNPASTATAPLSDYEKYGERGVPIPEHFGKMGWSPAGGGK